MLCKRMQTEIYDKGRSTAKSLNNKDPRSLCKPTTFSGVVVYISIYEYSCARIYVTREYIELDGL